MKATYDGKTISGEVSWDSSRSTVVKKSGSYKFVFEPDSSRYKMCIRDRLSTCLFFPSLRRDAIAL